MAQDQNKKNRTNVLLAGSAILMALAANGRSSSGASPGVPAPTPPPPPAPPFSPWYDLERYRQTPNQFDDEFDSGIAGLSAYQFVLGSTNSSPIDRLESFSSPISEWRVSDSRPSWLMFQTPRTGGAPVFMTKPTMAFNSVCQVASLSIDHVSDLDQGTVVACGMCETDTGMGSLSPIDGDNIAFVEVFRDLDGSGDDYYFAIFSVVDGGSSTSFPAVKIGKRVRFVAIDKRDTTFSGWASEDGLNWRYLGQMNNSSISPDRFALGAVQDPSSTNEPNEVMGISFLRFYPSISEL